MSGYLVMGIENKVEVVHSYAEPSEYDIELTIRNSAGRGRDLEQPIFIYENLLFLSAIVLNRKKELPSS